MPDDFTWDDLMHEIYVRQSVESGLKDRKEGRTKDVKEIRKKYGLALLNTLNNHGNIG